ncbi:telomerase RNA component interacting RNase-like isoform X1 [Haliotis rubra]|uniref:telomerase RNA component interacting RNase-like isoform X1 n=1 Tax=Haliotis rubra TaxID=36100 RepID=UPI001EE5CACA|nr:telomerase RNA component interacting RNase-like isoform X1 [Haliotis rubra]
MADGGGKRDGTEAKKRETVNKFANDGSFLEMFKKKMEESKVLSDKPVTGSDKEDSSAQASSAEIDSGKNSKTNILSIVGKRRGGSTKVLKTGMVKKPKQEEDVCICVQKTVTALSFLIIMCPWVQALLRTLFRTLFRLMLFHVGCFFYHFCLA